MRHNNQLPDNIPQLQNLIKRDPDSYRDEFIQQHRHYKSLLEVFRLHPSEFNKGLSEIVMFLAQVAHCYPSELSTFPQELVDLLQTNLTVLDSDMRMMFCRSLILLRNKNLLTPMDLLTLFFRLLSCQDKVLRTFLQTHIVTDVKNLNAKHKNSKLNKPLQNFMYSMLKDSNAKAAKMSVDIMIELYKKNIWNDAKTVNVIATACFSKFTKVVVAALKFFLGGDKEEEDDEEESESENEVDAKSVLMAHRVKKKTRKGMKQLKKVKKLVIKHKNKQTKAPVYNFSGLHLIHDPQGMAERLFAKLERTNERFEVKLMILDVISRLIGLHQLFLFNFYPYIQRFLQPHQREVTRIMLFAAQAAHELVPPEIMEPVVRTLVNNFVTERNSSDAIAMGLNAVREVSVRCPLAMSRDLLEDLAQYKKYREKSVMMAARSLIHVFRSTYPTLLHKKDRGRPTEAMLEVKPPQYGEVNAPGFVAGAEVILQKKKEKETKEENENGTELDDDSEGDEEKDDDNEDNDSDSDSDSWIDINSDVEDAKKSESKTVKTISKTKYTKNQNDKSEECKDVETPEHEPKGDKKMLAEVVSTTRLLSDEDFKKITSSQLRKEIVAAKKGTKRPAEEDIERGELVKLGDIENIYKKRRHDKEARLETVRKGQEDRIKYGYQDRRQNPLCSKTNREKSKKKNFMMIKHKVQKKVKRSFKDKQIALRNHLLKLKKMK